MLPVLHVEGYLSVFLIGLLELGHTSRSYKSVGGVSRVLDKRKKHIYYLCLLFS